jgi:hypothetical protein
METQMTIIATTGGIMACDTQLTVEAFKYTSLRPKITSRRSDGAIIGATGLTCLCNAVMDWFVAGEKGKFELPPNVPEDDFGYMVLHPNGRVTYTGISGVPLEIPSTYAIGAMSASYMALGAMRAGASAREAVQIAIDNTVNVGGGVYSISL